MASSFVRRYITPGIPERITLPSTAAMVRLHLDGQTRTIVLREHVVEIKEGQRMTHFIPLEEAGVYQEYTGKWYGYLSEDQL